jgi:putative phage-type endonuclease
MEDHKGDNVPFFDVDRVTKKYNLSAPEVAILEELRVDESQRESISQYEQGTPEWLKAREYRMTASRFGAARGHNPYSTLPRLLADMLWGEFQGNEATRHGNKYEPVAADLYTTFMRKKFQLSPEQFHVSHRGLLVSLKYPWSGVSVDGFVFDDSEQDPMRKRGGLEIKCPFGKFPYPFGQLYPFIPAMYYDQIQGTMGFLELPWWDFVVHIHDQTQIRRVEFDKTYFDEELFPRLEEFYMTKYLPRLVLKRQNRLLQGKIDTVMYVQNDSDTPTEMLYIPEDTNDDDDIHPPAPKKSKKSNFELDKEHREKTRQTFLDQFLIR